MLKPTDQAGSERPLGELVNQLVEDGKAYAHAEYGLYRSIAEAKARALAVVAALFGAAFVLALAAITALAVGVVFALARFMGPLAAGFVGLLIFAALAGGLGWYGVQRLKREL
jgi:sorbitol-specific phosphotransferase system component IIBC